MLDAREILARLGAREELIEEVCDIIAHHHHPGLEETVNFKAVYDADLLTNMEEQHKDQPADPEQLGAWIERALLTASGRELARIVLKCCTN